MGLSYCQLERYAEARLFLQRAYEIYRDDGLSAAEANALEGLGQTYFGLGDYTKARSYFERALQYAEQAGLKLLEYEVYYRLSRLHSEEGIYAEAHACLTEALTLGQQIQEPTISAACLAELGILFYRRGAYDLALTHCDQALERMRQIPWRYGEVPVLLQKSLLLLEQGRIDKARATLREGQTLARELQHQSFLFTSRILEAKLQAAAGERQAAMDALQDLFAEANTPDQQAETLYELWKVSDDPGWGERALAALIERYAKTPRAVYYERIGELRAALAQDRPISSPDPDTQ